MQARMQALRPVDIGLVADGDDFVAGVAGQRRSQMPVLAGKILMDKKNAHNKNSLLLTESWWINPPRIGTLADRNRCRSGRMALCHAGQCNLCCAGFRSDEIPGKDDLGLAEARQSLRARIARWRRRAQPIAPTHPPAKFAELSRAHLRHDNDKPPVSAAVARSVGRLL
jgi:hypothetical protein